MTRVLTLAALAVALFAAAPSAEARTQVPEGPYLDSCRNLYVEGDTLYGECQDNRGKWKKTWISGYAYCDGDIVNNNGVLDCAGGRRPEASEPAAPAAGGMPSGNWTKTCRDAILDGSILRASCRDNGGTWRPTWIDMRQCKSNTVDNDDGLLVCVAAAAPRAEIVALRDTLPGGRWFDMPLGSGEELPDARRVLHRRGLAGQRSRPEEVQARHGEQFGRPSGLRLAN